MTRLHAIAAITVVLTGTIELGRSAENDTIPAGVPPGFEIARFRYTNAVVAGKGTNGWTSGVTQVPLPPDEKGRPGFVISMAFDRQGLDAANIGIVAFDADGQELPPLQWSAASGTGTDHRVVTFVCRFDCDSDDIASIVILEILHG